MRQFSRTNPNCLAAGLAWFTLAVGVVGLAGPVTTDRGFLEVASNRDLRAPHLAAAVETSADTNGRDEPCTAGVSRSSALVDFDLLKRSAKAIDSHLAATSVPHARHVNDCRASSREDIARTPSYLALRRLLL